ncbi:hypothetical protein Tco_0831181 [Tanacetum coccineum]
MSQDIMHIAMNFVDILDVNMSYMNECCKCLELESELLKKKDFVEKEDLNAQLQEKVFAIATLKNELRKLKGKSVVDTAVSKPSAVTIAPEMFKTNLIRRTKTLFQKKPKLNDHIYNWIIAKYGKPNASWTDSQFDIVANDVYTTFFDQPEPAKDVEDVVKPYVHDVAKTDVKADQEVKQKKPRKEARESLFLAYKAKSPDFNPFPSYKLKPRMPPKRSSTSATPAMTQDAIRQLITDISAALEAQAAAMANADNPNRNTEPREIPIEKRG